jgi:hypothetical protein
MNKNKKWEIVFLFGMDTEKVSFQICDESQANKVKDHLEICHRIYVFASTKTKISLSYRCAKEKELDFLESKVVVALHRSLDELGIKDEPSLIMNKNDVAREAEKFLVSEGLEFARIGIKTPTFKELSVR